MQNEENIIDNFLQTYMIFMMWILSVARTEEVGNTSWDTHYYFPRCAFKIDSANGILMSI